MVQNLCEGNSDNGSLKRDIVYANKNVGRILEYRSERTGSGIFCIERHMKTEIVTAKAHL